MKQQEHTIKWMHRCCKQFPCGVVYAGNIRRTGESASCMVLYKAPLFQRDPVWRSLRREYMPHWEFPYDVVYAGNIRRPESSCMTQFTQAIYAALRVPVRRSLRRQYTDTALRVPVWRSLRRQYTDTALVDLLHAWFLIKHCCSKEFLYDVVDVVYAGNIRWICVMHGSW